MPLELANEGLVKAITHTITRLQNSSQIEFTYIPFGKATQLSEEKELNIYRIVAELLNNIVKHSKATKAIIQLVYHDNYLLISLEDNGIGINTNENTWGIGLKNINSRVEFMKAKIITDSNAKGTTFMIEVSYI
jgi:signal transduction histidine kinase